ncbi:anaphase-promoting complex subunit 1 [Senna tora]|uniref:Anaphase-promoting complex subunit 1 n=1 Tax=Senna tora TaxID=362788 RepID=A0A834SXW6_9FABA|nr:anaphase-promoting complex subunit 1 [Senna tora]
MKAQLWHLTQRTTALPLGRGAFTLATIYTLLTEVNLDPNIRNIQELKTWPEFHNVVSVGLRLAPLQIDAYVQFSPFPSENSDCFIQGGDFKNISRLLAGTIGVPSSFWVAKRVLNLMHGSGKMSRTWIIYNKPEEPNSIHDGLLLALELQGYLRVLNITDIYQYFY